jgi:hypothetical protein
MPPAVPEKLMVSTEIVTPPATVGVITSVFDAAGPYALPGTPIGALAVPVTSKSEPEDCFTRYFTT